MCKSDERMARASRGSGCGGISGARRRRPGADRLGPRSARADRPGQRAAAAARARSPDRSRNSLGPNTRGPVRRHAAGAAEGMERRGRRVRSSADDRGRDPPGGGELSLLPRQPLAGCGAPQHLARQLRSPHRGTDAGPAHHGFRRCAAGIHQGGVGLSRHPRHRRAADARARNARPRIARRSMPSRRPTASIATSSRRSGASSRTTRPRLATAACCARPRRSPASAAGRPTSRTNS